MPNTEIRKRRLREMEAVLRLALAKPGSQAETIVDPDATQPHCAAPSSILGEDLETTLDPEVGAPLSIQILLNAGREQIQFLAGRTFAEALADAGTPLEGLRLLKELGKLLLLPDLSPRMRSLGRALYFCSVAAARVHWKENIGSLSLEKTREALESLHRDGLPEGLLGMCREAAEE
jgi:hypothetical protein